MGAKSTRRLQRRRARAAAASIAGCGRVQAHTTRMQSGGHIAALNSIASRLRTVLHEDLKQLLPVRAS